MIVVTASLDPIRDQGRAFAAACIEADTQISAKTVEAHVSAVLRKLQLSSRHELTRWANDRRLI